MPGDVPLNLFIIHVYLQVPLLYCTPYHLNNSMHPTPHNPMSPAPLFTHPRPKIEPAQLGFRFRTRNRSPRSARARSLYLGLPPAQLPCPFHHPHSWHTLHLLFACLGQYRVHALGISCRRAKTFATTRSQCPDLPQLIPPPFPHLRHAPRQPFPPQTIGERNAPATGVVRQVPCPHSFFTAPAAPTWSPPPTTSHACFPLAIPAPDHYRAQRAH